MDITNRYFVIVMIAAAGVAAGTAFSNADSQSAVRQETVTVSSTESFVYFPAQFTLDAPALPTEPIQAF